MDIPHTHQHYDVLASCGTGRLKVVRFDTIGLNLKTSNSS